MLALAEANITFLHDTPPRGGTVIKLAEGLLWARLPLPFRLNHVNVWFLEEDDGWTVIDSGCNTLEIKEQWEALLAGPLEGRPLVRHIATHGHTDHIGLSGWLVERFEMPFVATLIEWMSPQLRMTEQQGVMRPDAEVHLRALGCPQAMIERLKADREWAGSLITPMPGRFQRIRNGDEIRFGRRKWRVITAGGHAAEHASFYCAEERLLIAGDQILPTISPMIGVWSEQPSANPLNEYLRSLDRFRVLPKDTLVLPSHGLPFMGLHLRIDQLQTHHRQRLDLLESLMSDGARTGMELAAGLFAKAVHEGHARLALAETVAHINYLIAKRRVARSWREDGLLSFALSGPAVPMRGRTAPARKPAGTARGKAAASTRAKGRR